MKHFITSSFFHFFIFSFLLMSSARAASYSIDTNQVRQHWDGWGVSLCWWAGQCGKWDEKKVDEIIDWLVSPDGLNYSHFRYNIGGGDDPENRHCDPHHMGKGKGLRAEMEGFKFFSGDLYHWERDSAQRKILLKIKEKRPDAVFEAFSNSCPYYMTYSGCVGGNADGGKDNLKPEYYEEFAHYLVDVCKHYKEAYGIEFKTLEPFNESLTSYWYRNGSQEGCHFDVQSQIAFLRVLAPILQESGLSTVISASDETSLAHSIQAIEDYREAGVLPLVGQWNTHTYEGTNAERIRLAGLVKAAGKPFWMSETGSGGKGIEGNLRLAQRLFDDIRLLEPEAWFDWQYMEERSDQWCTINGSFQGQVCRKVKNYYVRQQCSRFIRRGYDILQTDCPQTLAAVSPDRRTLVLVLLNEGVQTVHDISIPGIRKVSVWRTSASEDMAKVKDCCSIAADRLSITLPEKSITTAVVKL
ncbi:MAG: glycoside hydrolase [Bacteroidaceae bacterium]|nr:glycoside hydrolase [Bacteroidaceae bacterium]